MVRSLTKRGMPKPFAILLATLMALYLVPFVAAPAAQAATVGGFEIDGNFADDATAGIDWSTVLSAPSAQDDNPENTVFSASSKEGDNPNTWTASGSPPDKANFSNLYTYDQVVGGQAFFFFGWERTSPSGSDGYFLELNKLANHNNPGGISVPTRSVGDYRFKIDETGNETLVLSDISRWSGTAWVSQPVSSGFDYAVNTTAITRPGGGNVPADTFIEVSLNLTTLVGLQPSCPGAFGTGNFRSFTGASDKNLKDYVKGFPVDAGSTCVDIKTEATPQATVGASITDTATLDPITAQGTVTFKVYGPDDATCSGAAVFTSANRTVTNGQAVSAPFTPTVVGSYRWIAAFTSANTAVWANTTGKCNDANETSVIAKKQPTIKTNAAAGGPLPDSALTDVATVENLTDNATGTVTFKVYGPDDATCAGAAVFTSSKPLGTVNAGTAVVTSAPFTPTAVGRYRWIASYGGDDNNKSVAGACNDSNEFADVTKRQPTISTDAGPGGALPGVPLTDTATVANLTPDAGGTVTFALYGPNDATCSTTPVFTTTATFSSAPGGVATVTSSAYTATAAGTYRWVASYGGDAKNKTVAGQCNDAHESAVVTPANPKIVTDAQDTASLPHATITDTATLSGLNPGATGSIVFRLYGPSATPVCNDSGAGANLVFTSSSVPVNHGNGTYGPVQFTVTKAGTYYWVASYSGDANNNSVSGVCGETTEISDVDKATTEISTRATPTAKLPDGTLKDTATVTGLTDDATGNVVFNLYGPSPTPNCSGPAKFTSTRPLGTVTAGTAVVESETFTPVAAGSYYWTATYEGDSNNKPAVAACGADNETSVVNPSQTAISTDASSSQLPGASIHDSATVTGLTATAGGTVTFTLFGPSAQPNCTGTPIFTATKPLGAVAGGSATVGSGSFSPSQAGKYWWIASYSGDADNTSATGACGDAGETSTVSPATPEISTTATVSAALPAGTLSDTATLTGLTAGATGTVSFRLYGPDPTPGTPTCVDSGAGANLVFTSGPTAITNNGNGTASAQSGSYLPPETGTYFWVAAYSGDANNDAVAGACGAANETSTVTKASPTIATTATNASLPDGTIKDTATVSGLSGNAGGDVTFTLYGPSPTPDCTGAVRFTDTKALGAVVGGVASVTSASYTPTQAGKFYWIASYSGDGNNNPVVGQCGDQGETSTVTPAAPGITTEATDATLPGGTIQDVAKVTGLSANATGSVLFSVYGPSATADCTGTAVFTDLRPLGTVVAGKATATSAVFAPTIAGSYYWIASYSGDANNAPATGACGDTGETSTVSPATPTISTDASHGAQLPQGTMTDTATLTGVTDNAGGTVTFRLYGPDATPQSPTCSDGTLVYTSPAVAISHFGSGVAKASSPAFLPSVTGTYFWIATYSGDVNNVGVAGACGDQGETTTVTKAGPTVTTQVPAATERLAPTATLTDTATLTGATTSPKATGTITFTLYGPFDTEPGADSCTGQPVGTRSVTVDGNGSYSPLTGITVHVAGFYTWVASYSGDSNNESATHACGLPNETVEVLPAKGAITTDAVDQVRLSAGTTTITDQATLTGVTVDPAATGTIEFKVYGPFPSQPNADSCSTDTLVPGGPYTVNVSGPGTYTSPGVQVKHAGYYVWVAAYSGDDNNESATHACGQVEETTTVDKATPSVTTQVAAASVALPNASLVDTATLTGATTDPKATGTITFRLYGPFTSAPNAESCNGDTLVATKVVEVTNGNGSYASPAVVVDAAGFYTWVATYSGDAGNESATHPCAQESETVQVTKAPTSVATVATGSAVIKAGGSISDGATVTGLAAGATGTVTFALFGPDNATCSGTPVFTSTVALTVTAAGNGTATGSATSAAFTPTAAGTYRWIATYSGDGNNAAVAGVCNDPNEQSVVKAGDHPELDKFSNPASGSTVQPGSTIHYSVKVSNTGDVAITDADVVDILPPHVTVDVSSISDGGVLSADKTRITWKVTLAPADASSSADEKTLTYRVTVNANAPAGAVLVNTARFQGLEDTTTHVVPTGNLTLVKQVSPVAGNGVVVEFGDKLTYTLTASATGTLDQPNVIVTDYLPGSDPARPKSGETTYVAGSAKCIGAGTCVVTGPDANGLITWSLGSMAAGTSRQVTFQVTIDDVTGDDGETIAVDILNAGAVRSDRTPSTPSNEVVTPVTKVLPVKIPNKPPKTPETLPRTGTGFPVGTSVGGALALITLGMLMVAVSRRQRPYTPSD